AFLAEGKAEDAAQCCRRAVQLDPALAGAWHGLGEALGALGRGPEALDALRRAVELAAEVPNFHLSLAEALDAQGQPAAANDQYRELVQKFPQWVGDAFLRGWVLAAHPDARRRDGPHAVKLAAALCRVSGNREPHYLDLLAAAYAEAGRFADAE